MIISHALKWHVRGTALRAYSLWLRARAVADKNLHYRDDISWLLVATLPNSGSTALSKLLQGSAHAAALTASGEGQWLLPTMSAPGKRWQPDRPVDYAAMRRSWLSRVPKANEGQVVIDKSPSNLCRLEAVADALAPMPVKMISLTRDPYATIASWKKRYSPTRVAHDWKPELRGKLSTDEAFLEALGLIWGEWAGMLNALRSKVAYHTSYEELVAAPQDFLAQVTALYPALSDIDPTAEVSVKDYTAQPLRNMNEEQIATLTQDQISAVTKGLRAHEAVVDALGYQLRG